MRQTVFGLGLYNLRTFPDVEKPNLAVVHPAGQHVRVFGKEKKSVSLVWANSSPGFGERPNVPLGL